MPKRKTAPLEQESAVLGLKTVEMPGYFALIFSAPTSLAA